jgi:hypothetical protein
MSCRQLKKVKGKGISLIFVLMSIGLMLILAISFIANSIFNQRALRDAANSTIVRSLASSTITRVLSMLEIYDDGNLHSASPANLTDMIERLDTENIYDWNSDSKATWELVKGQGKNDNRIIGRVAYLLSSGSGIDPAACVAPGKNEGLYPEKRLGAKMSDINLRSLNLPEDNQLLIDKSIALKLSYNDVAGGRLSTPAIGSWVDYDTLFSQIAPLNSAQKKMMKACFLIDPPQDQELFWLDKNRDHVINEASELFNRFNLNRSLRAWNELKISTLLSEAKVYNAPQPNSGGLPWLAYLGKVWNGKIFVDDQKQRGSFPNVATRRLQIAANLKDYCDNDTDAAGVPHDIPTTNIAPINWSDITKLGPTYTGNERLPMLNEVSGYIKLVPKKHNNNILVRTEGAVAAEIINLYGIPFTKLTKVTVYGSYKFSIQFKQKKAKSWQVKFRQGTFSKTIDLSDSKVKWSADNATTDYDSLRAGKIKISANGYKMSWANAAVDFIDSCELKFNIIPNKGGALVRIGEAQMTISRAVLEYDGNNVDIAIWDRTKPLNDGGFIAKWKNILMTEQVDNSWVPHYLFACAVAIDPRQNLNPGDWLTSTPVVIGSFGSAVKRADVTVAYRQSGGSEALPNCVGKWSTADKVKLSPYSSYLAVPGSGDFEKDTYNPVNISTNLIRNAPMQSPWEIGFIHRGAAWQTINLSKFDVKHAVNYKDGTTVGQYGVGDGNILDQIKMNNALANPKKVNLRIYNQRVFSALFDRIKLNCSRHDLAGVTSGKAISSLPTAEGNVPVVVGALRSFIPHLTTRASVINAGMTNGNDNVSHGILSSGVLGYQRNDAAKEEIIGKIINLVEAGKKTEYFKLLILAQAINDIGGSNGKSIKIVKRFKDSSRYVFEAKIGQFDIAVKTVEGENDIIYADEITAEQKIAVLVHRNQLTGKCSIISIEYIN